MRTAVNCTPRFHAMAEDGAIAMSAARRECVRCAFEAVKDVLLSTLNDGKALVVVVTANFTPSHTQTSEANRRAPGIQPFLF